MLEKTHIGIESHKTQLWFELADNDTKWVSDAVGEIMQLESLTTKRKKQGQVGCRQQSGFKTHTHMNN